jgi:uncharacterized protein
MDESTTLVNDAERNRYILRLGEQELGFIDYSPVGSDVIDIRHTEVAPGHEGKGYGSALVRGVLDDVRAQHKTVLPTCPYALAFIRRHREYVDLVREDLRASV